MFTVSALIANSNAHAQWSPNPTVNTAVCTASGAQGLPQVVSDGGGGAIVVWEDARNGGDADIYAARLADDGRLWPNNTSARPGWELYD
jgi:hypothetical protein